MMLTNAILNTTLSVAVQAKTTVSTSSMRSGYQAMYAGMQELVWLWGVGRAAEDYVQTHTIFPGQSERSRPGCQPGVPQEVQAHSH